MLRIIFISILLIPLRFMVRGIEFIFVMVFIVLLMSVSFITYDGFMLLTSLFMYDEMSLLLSILRV